MTTAKRAHAAAVVLAALLAGGCAARYEAPRGLGLEASSAEESAPLAGTALLERKQQMQRALGDLVHFRTTLETLRRRHDRKGLEQLANFVDGYLGTHLDPMLLGEWQSRHPELMGLDANLRFMKADVLIRMRETGRAQRVIDEIRTRFAGREDMLVAYPPGRQNTLADGLERLRGRKWRG